MTCSVKFVRLNEIYMCTEFHMNMCKYVWAIHQVFRLCSRGRRRAPVPRPGPSLCGVLMAADSNVCANFQEFLSTLRPPKVTGRLKKKINRKKKIILWKTIGPCALLAWALIILRKSIGPCALLAWALIIILRKSIGPCALLAWALIILWKTIGPCALLAWALIINIAASSDGGPKPSVQPPPRWHQEKGAQRAHAFTVTLWQSGFNWYKQLKG